jgi:pyrimidine-nucleoside phosphorylase
MISLHGGDIDAFLSTYGNGGIAASAKTLALKAPRKGYISHIDAMKVAQASLDLGAGREKADDKIDLSAGVKFLVKRGAPVNEGDTILFAVTSTREDKLEFVRTILEDAIHISDEMPSEKLLILERVI